MEQRKASLWYLLEWNDRDKCLLVVAFFALLQLFYWLLIYLVANFTNFGRIYVAADGYRLFQWLMLTCELLWLALFLWGVWQRKRHQQSRFYRTTCLYLLCFPLLTMGHMIGLYSPVLGVILLGSSLTGAILFEPKHIIGPFSLAVAITLLATLLVVQGQLEYAPLIQLDPVSKSHVSGYWITFIVIASIPFVAAVFMVTYLLLSRWHEREDMVRQLSVTDALTGLPNRRALFSQVEYELKRVHRNASPLALAMMDLDHFKQVNDTWGHAAGDAVLQQVARLVPSLLRDFDLFGRIGGEEFVILMNPIGLHEAEKAIERCRQTIAATPVQLNDGRELNISASFGICFVHGQHQHELHYLLSKADKALYAAKNAGRNCIRVADKQP